MRALVRGLVLRRLRLEPGRTLLLVLGVALGVAVFVAVRGLNRTALESLGHMGEVATGTAALEIEGGSAGVSLDLLEKVRATPGVRAATPVVARFAREAEGATGGEQTTTKRVLVLGLDLLDPKAREAYGQASNAVRVKPELLLFAPHAAIVGRPFARSRGLEPGKTFQLFLANGRTKFTVAGDFEPEGALSQAFGGEVIVVALPVALEVFGTPGRCDKIEVAVKDGADPGEVARALKPLLGPDLEARAPGAPDTNSASLLGTMQLGLELASTLALIIGQFLIYNAMSIAVVRRRPEIGVLRAIGATKAQLAFLVIAEAAAFGIAGSGLGIAIGWLLGRFALGAVSAQVSQLYATLDARTLTLGTSDWVIGLAAGPLATILATIPPVVQALRVSPVEAARKDLPQRHPGRAIGIVALVGVAALLGCAIVYFAFPVTGYLAGAALEGGIAGGLAFMAPRGLVLVVKNVRPLLARFLGPVGALAGDNLLARPGRAGVTVAALMIALGGVFSIATLVASLEVTIKGWVERVLAADVYAAASSPIGGQANTIVDAAVTKEMEQVEGVDRAYPIRFVFEKKVAATLAGGLTTTHPALIMALDVEFIGRRSRLPVTEAVNGSPEEAIALIMSGGEVGVSENLARIRGFHVGDALPIVTPTGVWSPKISMCVKDFTSEHGTVFVNRAVYAERWHDTRANAIDIFLKPGADSHATTERLRAGFAARYDLFITEQAPFRQRVLAVVEEVFTVTYAMELVAIGVALLGVVTTLFAAILERTREIGVLRAVGASKGHIRLAVMTEAFLMGAVASGFACTTGALLGLVLVKRVIAGTYGFDLDFVLPASSAVFGVVAATGLATLASLLPAARAARIHIVEALAYQ